MPEQSVPNEQPTEDLQDRVASLEKWIAQQPAEKSFDWLRLFDIVSKALIPVLIFYLAFAFKDSVQQALEYRKLEVDSADAIEKLLNKLHKPNIEDSEAVSASLTLSAYGQAAIMPLISVFEHGSASTEPAAKRGLFFIGLNHPDIVTRDLAIVLARHDAQFRWQTHKMAIEILGQLGRPDAREILCAYQPFISKPSDEGLKSWQKIIRNGSNEAYIETQKGLQKVLAGLTEGDKNPCG